MKDLAAMRPLLDVDPDLGDCVTPEQRQSAMRDLLVPVISVPSGVHPLESRWEVGRAGVGVLLAEGFIAREIRLQNAPSAELLGPGDLIRMPCADARPPLVTGAARLTALTGVQYAILGPRTTLALSRYPTLNHALLERLYERSERLAMTQAISQLTGVDERVEGLLRHLGQRWGKVSRDGVIIPLVLSHTLLAALVGARRPTVSLAVAKLAREGRVLRRADGAWLVPAVPDSGTPAVALDALSALAS